MKIIGILRGGGGNHYQTSLERGASAISHLWDKLSEKWKPVDVFVDKAGQWHLGGLPVSPAELKHKVDLIWNLAHPSTHQFLHNFSIPYAGAPHFFSALEHNPQLLREFSKNIGFTMPRHIVLPAYQEDFDGPKEKYAARKAREIFEKFGAPWIVKSFTPDANMGMHVAKTYPELVKSIMDGVHHDKSILIEELITGKPASTHTVEGFRGEDIYAFPPGKFTEEEKEKLMEAAKVLHRHFGAGHYLKCDFVITPRGKLCLLAVESMPDVRDGSHFHEACESVGVRMHNVIEHILERAFK